MSKLGPAQNISANYPELRKCWFEFEVLNRKSQCISLNLQHCVEESRKLLAKNDLSSWREAGTLKNRLEQLRQDIQSANQKRGELWDKLVDALIPALSGPEADANVWILLGIKGQIPEGPRSRLIEACELARTVLQV